MGGCCWVGRGRVCCRRGVVRKEYHIHIAFGGVLAFKILSLFYTTRAHVPRKSNDHPSHALIKLLCFVYFVKTLRLVINSFDFCEGRWIDHVISLISFLLEISLRFMLQLILKVPYRMNHVVLSQTSKLLTPNKTSTQAVDIYTKNNLKHPVPN